MNKIILVFFIAKIIFAQNLDSLYNQFIMHNSKYNSGLQIQVTEDGSNKCGFGLNGKVREHLKDFTYQQQQKIEQILERPNLSKSIVSPSGIFRIHYNDIGSEAPEYDINELAIAFDSSYTYEIDYVGYPAPPKDGSNGADDKYDVYILNLSRGTYGTTTQDSIFRDGRSTSYIEMDNSFNKNEGYNTYGIYAAKATAAHEFHHAIQLGSYGLKTIDTYYYELTSTAFEEFVFTDVNDYYAYIGSFLRNTSQKFENNTGYNLAIWNLFLSERFKNEDQMLGHKIVKRSWELMFNNGFRATVAVSEAMLEFNKYFGEEFSLFASWLNFTNVNAISGLYFEEAANYPLLKSTYNFELGETEKIITISTNPTSINYLNFTYGVGMATDTILAVITNSDVYGSTISGSSQGVEFTISKNSFVDAKSIDGNYFSKLSTDKGKFINDSYIINNQFISGISQSYVVDFAYPQPLKRNETLNIPTFSDASRIAELYIYSSDMNLIYNGSKSIPQSGDIVVTWNGKKNDGTNAASGVYIFFTKAGDKLKKGKFVILNQ